VQDGLSAVLDAFRDVERRSAHWAMTVLVRQQRVPLVER
jgi:hypothetical protein